MKQPDITAVIISLNSKHYLRGCLDSMMGAEWRSVVCEYIVVDNGSTDGTVEMLREEYPTVRIIANPTNLGYCKAGNQGAEAANARYVIFLNDDILIIEDALPKLVEWMDENPKVGAIGSRLLNLDGTDQWSSGRNFPTPMNALFSRKSPLTRLFPNAPWAKHYFLTDRIDTAEPYKVDWLSAAALMVRKEAWAAVGGLAEDFYYFHELIFCDRLARAGWPSYLHPQSKIIHYEGAGSGVRTRRVRRRHIERFHKAAYVWFCAHHRVSQFNPIRLPLAAILAARASFLIVADSFKSERQDVIDQSKEGRPEGGVAI